MNMSRRNKIIIGVAVLILIVLLISFLAWWWYDRKQAANSLINTNSTAGQLPGELPTASSGLPTTTVVVKPDQEAIIKAVAMTFAERFGSYSNEINFSNLDDLQNIITVKMKTWVDNYKVSEVAKISGSNYYGITTKALSVKINSMDDIAGRAEVVVQTQRGEAKGSSINPKIFYQAINLSMINDGSGWKIDSADWQAIK
ncbi:MAG: hypothetical protein PHW95_02865 [Patescibacteria group bacterium]|nr:hypothetical protein [Patescibacteria group bacterium]